MKKLILLGFLLFSFCVKSQTFVKDIDRVAVVVIDYCVDKNGKRYNETINQEKTTYKDEGWKLGCLESFKKAQLVYPMKMTNDCWQHVYHFVNEELKTRSLPKNEQKKCKTFHKGKYKYHSPAYSNTKIIRRKNKQIEKSPDKDQRQVYKINWIDDHIYTLRSLKLPLEKDKHKIGKVVYVEIIEIIDEDTYVYKSYFKNDPNNKSITFGIISKL